MASWKKSKPTLEEVTEISRHLLVNNNTDPGNEAEANLLDALEGTLLYSL